MCSIILTPNEIQADNSEFGIYLQSPIKLNPSLEWKAAVIDAYIPYSIDVTKTTTTTAKSKEQYWFRFIIEKGLRTDTPDDYKSYEKFYYNPYEHYLHMESFIDKVNEIERKKIQYGEFTKQHYPPTIQMFVENDHMVIKVIRKMDRDNECIAFIMPGEQYLEFFGGRAEFDTYYKGGKLLPKPGFQSVCKFDYHVDALLILASTVTTYVTDEEHDPTQESYLGIEFRSADKIRKRKDKGEKYAKEQTVIKGDGILFDVECSLIETTRLGTMQGGTKVLDVLNANGHENVHPKYLKVETVSANYIFVKLVKSSDKLRVVITGKPYIVINIRPKLYI